MSDFDRISRIGRDPDLFKVKEKLDHTVQKKPKKKKEDTSFKEELLKKERDVLDKVNKKTDDKTKDKDQGHAKYRNGKRIL